MSTNEYELLDSGYGRKLERFGEYVLDRPCAQAFWHPQLPKKRWNQADALFTREGDSVWEFRNRLPKHWFATVNGIKFEISPTDFGHVGIFPEHIRSWSWMEKYINGLSRDPKEINVLNLFAYSGGATLAAAKTGVKVCHLDASKKMVEYARRNAAHNQMADHPIRWIVDDVQKFLGREERRGNRYHGIILDPPSFGRGKKQELFKIDMHLLDILKQCQAVLAEEPLFVFFSCHTPGYTPLVINHLLKQHFGDHGNIETGEMTLAGQSGALPVPSGAFGVWSIQK